MKVMSLAATSKNATERSRSEGLGAGDRGNGLAMSFFRLATRPPSGGCHCVAKGTHDEWGVNDENNGLRCPSDEGFGIRGKYAFGNSFVA